MATLEEIDEEVEQIIKGAVVRGRFPGTPRDELDDLAQDIRLNMLVQKRDKLPQLAAEGILEASVNRLVRCFQIDRLRTYKSTRAREEYVAQARGACVSVCDRVV